MVYRLTRTAEDQIDTVLLESAKSHGLEKAGRYGELILTVMAALGDTPNMTGSIAVPHLRGIRAYPIRLGRRRVEPARRVATPGHLIIYRVASDGVVEILGLIHDRMLLSRAARRIVRNTDEQ